MSLRSESDKDKTNDPFQMAFDHSSISHVLTALDGHLMRVNQAMAEMLGYTQAELMGINMSKITHPDDLAASHEVIRCLKAGEQETYRLEKRYLHRNGNVIWAIVNTSLLHDANGQPLYFITDIIDITDQFAANTKIRRLAAIVESSSDAIFSVNIEKGTITSWNTGAQRLFGYTAEAIIGLHIQKLAPPKYTHESLSLMKRIQQGESIIDFETQRIAMDGKLIDVSLTISPVKDHTSRIIEASGIVRDITARKQTENALQKSQKLLNDSQRIAKVGAWQFDVVTEQVLWSDEVYRIHGLTQESVNLQKPEQAFQFYQDEDQHRIREAFQQAVEQGKSYDLELSLTTASGQNIWVRTDGHAEFKGGKVIRVFGNIMDITKRKRAEDKLQSSLHLLQAVLENIPMRVFWKDNELRYLGCNTAFAHDTGMEKPEDLLGKDDFQMGWHTQAEKYRADDKAVITSKTPKFNIEEQQTIPDGKITWRRTSKVPLYQDNKKVMGILGIYEDITQWKLNETALRESEVRYRSLFEGAGEGIVIADFATMKALHVNPAMGQILGYTPEELLSFELFATVGEGKAKEAKAIFAKLEHSQQSIKGEMPLLHKDGRLIYAQVTSARVIINGKLCIIGFFTDITQRKQAEAERLQLLEQLNQAQKMEAVGRLAGGVAHDFNNMLSVIQGYAELALMQVKAGEKLFRPLSEIQSAAIRSGELTQQLLAFARKQPRNPRVLNLNETVTGMLRMLGRLIGEDILLLWQPSSDLNPVMLDPSQVDQILANLIVNARDAIQGVGKVIIETSNVILDESDCQLHPDSSPGEYVLLAVSDNGCGMSKELLTQIFDPFFTTKEKGKGTGLGLSTVYGIVKQNKGLISVHSELGVGSTFNIHLPVTQPTVDPEATAVDTVIVGGNETVLLVDDEPGILSMAKEVLLAYGYRVIAAASPIEALATAAEYTQVIDLLLTDVIMPDMNGMELSLQLTAQRPKLRTLYMSGYTGNVVAGNVIAANNALAKGMAFLQKPFSVKDLAAKVRQVLDTK